nr:sensor histidine kinase [Desulfobacula sp.]
MQKVGLKEIRQEIRMIFKGHGSSLGKHIREEWPKQDITLYTDPLLVSRILGNMVINAFEASDPDETIGLTTRAAPGHVSWEVRNNGHIPPEIQKKYSSAISAPNPAKGEAWGPIP